MALIDVLQAAVILLYFMGTLLFFAGVLGRMERLKPWAFICAAAGFLLHTTILLLFIPGFSFSTVTQGFFIKLLSWSVVLMFFILRRIWKLEFLSLIASPLALLLFIFSLTFLDLKIAVMPKALSGLFLGLHIGSLFISFSLLAGAFGAGIIFLHLDSKIKAKEKLSGFRLDLPALSTIDKVNHWAVIIGFPLFTLGILSGFVWARLTWGRVISSDPKEIISIIIWLLFAFLFYQRSAMDWRGRKPAVLAVWIFALAVVSLVGINFFLPTHHSFIEQPL